MSTFAWWRKRADSSIVVVHGGKEELLREIRKSVSAKVEASERVSEGAREITRVLENRFVLCNMALSRSVFRSLHNRTSFTNTSALANSSTTTSTLSPEKMKKKVNFFERKSAQPPTDRCHSLPSRTFPHSLSLQVASLSWEFCFRRGWEWVQGERFSGGRGGNFPFYKGKKLSLSPNAHNRARSFPSRRSFGKRKTSVWVCNKTSS